VLGLVLVFKMNMASLCPFTTTLVFLAVSTKCGVIYRRFSTMFIWYNMVNVVFLYYVCFNVIMYVDNQCNYCGYRCFQFFCCQLSVCVYLFASWCNASIIFAVHNIASISITGHVSPFHRFPTIFFQISLYFGAA